MKEISRREREKQAREEDILDAAERIFGSQGVDAASMDEIARAADFTRKTLYQHFGSKDELLCAVLLRGFRRILDCMRSGVGGSPNGFDRIKAIGNVYYAFYREHTDFFRLINYSSRMKAVGREEQKSEFDRIDRELFQAMAKALADGKADGSIRGDVDVAMATPSIIFTVTGFFFEYSATGKSFTEHLGLDGEKFVQYTLDLLLDSLRPKQ